MHRKQEVVFKTETARVRIMELQPNETTRLHHHSEVTDNIFGLNGYIAIHLKDPDKTVKLHPGTRCEIRPGRWHMVSNLSPDRAATYLLVQGVGIYDFLT